MGRLKCIPVDLPVRIAGKDHHMHKELRDHIARDLLGKGLLEHPGGDLFVRFIERAKVLAAPVVPKAPYDYFAKLREQASDRVLHFFWLDPIAVDFYNVVRSAEQLEAPIIPQAGKIVGIEVSHAPDGNKGIFCHFGQIPVTAEIGQANAQHSFLLRHLAVPAQQAHIDKRTRPSDRCVDLGLFDTITEGSAAKLTHRITIEQSEPMGLKVRDGFTTGENRAKRKPLFKAEVSVERCGHEGMADPFSSKIVQHRLAVPYRFLRQNMYGIPLIEREERGEHRRNVHHGGQQGRAHGTMSLRAVEERTLDLVICPRQQIPRAVFLHHALRLSRGTGGINDISKIVRIRLCPADGLLLFSSRTDLPVQREAAAAVFKDIGLA